MNSARAALFTGNTGELTLTYRPDPRPNPGEVLVRVLACTLCGSDGHSFSGRRQVPVPTVLGHEIVGEIAYLPNPAPRDLEGRVLQIGDRVTWAIVAHCGTCFYCCHGLPQKCERAVKYGHEVERPSNYWRGGLADYCLLAPGTSILRLPSEIPLGVACPANCATATVAAAWESVEQASQGVPVDLTRWRVGIWGAGLLGLTACAMARSAGVAEVIAVDPFPRRRMLAHAFGATQCFAPSEVPSTIPYFTEGKGLDAILDFTGAPSAFYSQFAHVRMGGRLVLVGAVFPAAPVSLRLDEWVRRQISLCGIHNYAPRHLQRAVEFLHRHHNHFPFVDVVSDWFPLEEAESAFAAARDPHKIRVGVCPDLTKRG